MQSFRRKGNAYDTGMHYVGGIGEGQSLYEPFKELELLNLPWQHLDSEAFDKVTLRNPKTNALETFSFVEGYDNFVRHFSERFPDQKDGLLKYVDLLRRCNDNKMEFADVNAWRWLHETFSDELLINVLSGTSLKMELRRETLPLFTFAHNNSGFIESSWRLKGDGNLIVERLIKNITAGGGRIICDMEVTELIEKDGKIVEAVCMHHDKGTTTEERFAADTFISNAHPAVTCALVKESQLMKKVFKRRMTNLENTFGMFTCQLKLKDPSEITRQGLTPVPYYNYNMYVYDTSDVWTMHEEANGKGILISTPAPKFTQEGQTPMCNFIDILTPMHWAECEKWADTTIGHRGDDYKAFKQAKAEACIKLAETQIPGLHDMIDEMYCSTPLTWRDYNNTPNGSAYGIRKDCTMPIMTILTPRTPIPNLYMTGQNLMVHGLQGVTITAKMTCDEILK